MSLEDNANKILEQIVEKNGIEVIKNFIKVYNKKKRQQSKRVNYYDEIAVSVYELVFFNNYSKDRAQRRIAEEKNITYYTVRNHCAKFDKEAREFDYYSFGALIENSYNLREASYDIELEISTLANLNDIQESTARIYYYKYKNDKKEHNINFDKFIKPAKVIAYENIDDENLPF